MIQRYSGTLSIINQINQYNRVARFWITVALSIALTVSTITAMQIADDVKKAFPGYMPIYCKFELWQAAGKVGLHHEFLKPKLPPNADLRIVAGNLLTIRHMMRWVPINGAVGFGTMIIVAFFMARRERILQTAERFKRGARKFSPQELNVLLKKSLGAGIIRLGAVTIPFKLENLSFFLIGRPQQGKTQIILRILDTIIERGDRAIVWCAKKEDFITTHFRPGIDYIFCPGDERSMRWSLKNDIEGLMDFEDIAARLIPDSNDKSGPWNKGARDITVGLLRFWWLKTDRSNAELARIFHADIEVMHHMLSETPGCGRAAGLLENSKTATAFSFYISVAVHVKPFDLLELNDGDFSIRKYLKEGNGNIYVLSGGRMKKALQPVQTLFIDLFMINHMDLPQDRTRRIWYFLDELPALNKLPRLEELLNVGPSYGASCIIGAQSFALLDNVYDETGRRAIFNACNTAVVFSVGDDRTAEELAKNLGKEETTCAKGNYTIAVNDGKDSTTTTQDDKLRELYLPDQIKGLKPLTCLVRILSFGVTETILQLKVWTPNNPAFIPDPKYSLEAYEAHYLELMEKQTTTHGAGGQSCESDTMEGKSASDEWTEEEPSCNNESQDRLFIINNDDVF